MILKGALYLLAYLISFFFVGIMGIDAEAAPRMTVVPTCEPTNSVSIAMNTNGFEPNTNVKWKIEETRSSYIPASGSYQTNATGGFHDTVLVKDLSDGNYTVYFGEIFPQYIPTYSKIVVNCMGQSSASPHSISINATLKEGDYVKSNLYFQNSTISFGGNSSICPDNQCRMEFVDTTFNEIGLNRYFTGTLKVEDKANSNQEFAAFNYYKLGSGTFQLTTSKENPKTGEKILYYTGTFGISKGDSFVPDWGFDSKVELRGDKLMLKGKATDSFPFS